MRSHLLRPLRRPPVTAKSPISESGMRLDPGRARGRAYSRRTPRSYPCLRWPRLRPTIPPPVRDPTAHDAGRASGRSPLHGLCGDTTRLRSTTCSGRSGRATRSSGDEHEAYEGRSRDLEERLTRIEHDREAIGGALIQARRIAAELEASARKEADACVEEARAQAEAITQEAQAAADQRARESEERLEQVAEETRLRVEADTRQAREDVARLRAEVEQPRRPRA